MRGGARKGASGSPASAAATPSASHQKACSISVQGQRGIVTLGDAGDHQRGREGPGLAHHIADRMDRDAGFLLQFARDRFLDRLARLDEAGERGIAAGRPAMLAAEQHPSLMLGEHDRNGIDAREMFGRTGFAAPRPAGLVRMGRPTADRAEAMPGMPEDEAARGAVERNVGRGDEIGEATRPRRRIGALFQRLDQMGKDRPILQIDAEQCMLLDPGIGTERGEGQPMIVRHRLQPFEDQQPGIGRGKGLRMERGIAADMVDPVERAADETGQAVRLGVSSVHRPSTPSSPHRPPAQTGWATLPRRSGRAATIPLHRQAHGPAPHG
jgi:hypothetical protein